jgi:hypothetical protein
VKWAADLAQTSPPLRVKGGGEASQLPSRDRAQSQLRIPQAAAQLTESCHLSG